MQAGQVLYSRYQDGARPVRVLERGFEVFDSEGKTKQFTTAQGLLAELTGHPKGRHWTLERYFRTKSRATHGGIDDLFGVSKPKPVLKALAPSLITLGSDITPVVPGVVVKGAVGIDLDRRGHEVRKLFYKVYGAEVRAKGYDPEDVLQEVYRGLLARNRGTCPWTPSKGSFGHYVCMVAKCIILNYGRKQRRIRSMEQIGITGFDDGSIRLMDVAESPHVEARGSYDQEACEVSEAQDDLIHFIITNNPVTDLTRLAVDIIPDVAAGWTRKLIAAKHDCSMPALSRAISLLRKSSRQWGGRV